MEFQLGALVTLSNDPQQPVWPDSQQYLFAFNGMLNDNKDGRLDDLAKVVQRNSFEMVVIVALVFGQQLTQHRQLAKALKATVNE